MGIKHQPEEIVSILCHVEAIVGQGRAHRYPRNRHDLAAVAEALAKG